MLPATKAIPKEMVAVAGKPAVQWVVEAASPRAWKRSSS
jgi:UTP-glucose-1-phosphate uridylyltransferase